MRAAQIRQLFLEFFASKNHTIVPSSGLVPNHDSTLLFTNAGMVQFKDVFLGFDKRPYTRAASSQRCVRAGGKHNDLENVGYTARHHTFFEMLGNFSFGDYFKHEAIAFAWEFLTSVNWLNIPKEKLWVTVYHTDHEAYSYWTNNIGIALERVIRIGDNTSGGSDNFWQMGEVGPCGPCTEIFYDHGPEIAGGPPGSPNDSGDRYIEIWNCVFMQYNRDETGALLPLPQPSVDTGMGLERIAAVMQHVHSNYEIDLFKRLIDAVIRETQCADTAQSTSLKVIADHIRSCSFLIADGVMPNNEGRGYVLRRIIRRAIRHGYKLGQKQAFFYKLVPDLVDEMGAAYPILKENASHIIAILRQEEERFTETLESGMQLLESALKDKPTVLSGEVVFKLYDTYGFPVDMTLDVARERDIAVDTSHFEKIMQAQRDRARASSKFTQTAPLEYQGPSTYFVGYETYISTDVKVLALYQSGKAVDAIEEGENAIVVLNTTPFYAESGGQVGDIGELSANQPDAAYFIVEDTRKIQAEVFGHYGTLKTGKIQVGDLLNATVNNSSRRNIASNHSATHLLHAALRQVLGKHVTQKGSLVNAERLRFDFSHSAPLTIEQIDQVEQLVNTQIRNNHRVITEHISYSEAISAGAMALFDEKYGEKVRVLCIGGFSTELCGGTHVKRSGDIGYFRLISETGISAATRRVEALTAEAAIKWSQDQNRHLHQVTTLLKVPSYLKVVSKLSQLQQILQNQEREIEQLQDRYAACLVEQLRLSLVSIADNNLLVHTIDAIGPIMLRKIAEKLREQCSPAIIVLACINQEKVAMVAAVSHSITQLISAVELVNFVAKQVEGKGGGRADIAQASGKNPIHLQQALQSVAAWIRLQLRIDTE